MATKRWWSWCRCSRELARPRHACAGTTHGVAARRLHPQRSPAQPSYAVAPHPAGRTCSANPAIAEELLLEGQRLGGQVMAGPPELPGKDASYRAEHGLLGTIRLKQRPMSAEVRCLLISNEFIHVLQHLHGKLKGVPPLGWGPSRDQEAEAYAHQNQAGHVLQLLRATPGPSR